MSSHHGLYGVVFAFLIVTLFDTTGTMIGVAKQAGLMKGNKLPRARHALLADSVATTSELCSGQVQHQPILNLLQVLRLVVVQV